TSSALQRGERAARTFEALRARRVAGLVAHLRLTLEPVDEARHRGVSARGLREDPLVEQLCLDRAVREGVRRGLLAARRGPESAQDLCAGRSDAEAARGLPHLGAVDQQAEQPVARAAACVARLIWERLPFRLRFEPEV